MSSNNCSNCHGSGEVKSEVTTCTYDSEGNLIKEENKTVIVPCPQCKGMEDA